MSTTLGESEEFCLSLAKSAIKNIAKKLNINDRIGLCTFNENSEMIFELDYLSEINNFQRNLNKIKCHGGTNIIKGMTMGLEMMKNKYKPENEKKILLITDMQDSPELNLIQIISEAILKKNIFTVIIGVGMRLICDLANEVVKGRGSMIFSATKEEDLHKLYSQFEYIFFPVAYNVSMEFKSNDFTILKS